MAKKKYLGLDAFGDSACSMFLHHLPISGVAISMFPGHATETLICASDATAARVDELQSDLGEGPRWEAVRIGRPVQLPNVKSSEHPEWPVFAKALMELDVAAYFVFPLALGALSLGVVELYSSRPGPLSATDSSTALRLADSLAWDLLKHVLTMDGQGSHANVPDGALLSRREVHQATGMVLAQAGVSATDALLLLRAHAFAQGLTVREIALEVVNKKLDFTPPAAGQ